MGQKVRPTGFRTGIMVDWLSSWYASKQDFPELLIEDRRIRDFIKRRYGGAGVSKVRIHRTRERVTVYVHAARVGMIIGKKGQEGAKRVKYRKSQRGTVKGTATRGNTVAHGEFGLQALEGGWLSAEAIEAGRITATHSVRGEGRLYIRVFPHKSVTAIPAETRMGKGKGEPEYWAAVVKPGMILYEIAGLPEAAARDALARVAYKMPFRCRFVTRRPSV